jgi:hypothetical protein
MSASIAIEDVGERFARRELYRRASRMADAVIEVVDRVWYATVKQS